MAEDLDGELRVCQSKASQADPFTHFTSFQKEQCAISATLLEKLLALSLCLEVLDRDSVFSCYSGTEDKQSRWSTLADLCSSHGREFLRLWAHVQPAVSGSGGRQHASELASSHKPSC